MEKTKTTVTDVARKAGVSIGTVDRVLHDRGEVSEKTKAKVKAVIKELGYEMNLNASLLAKKDDLMIASIQPEHDKEDYWDNICTGYRMGRRDCAKFGTQGKVWFFNQYDAESFKKTCAEVLAAHPDGVILPPFFPQEAHDFAETLAARNIPYVLIDTKIHSDSYLAFFGTQMYRSGELCGYLLTERLTADEVKKVLHLRLRRDKDNRSDPTVNRRRGFYEYLEQHFPDCERITLEIDPQDPEGSNRALAETLEQQPDIKLIAMLSSRINIVSRTLAKYRKPDMRIIGFDNLAKNIEALKDGTVDILIASKVTQLSYSAYCLLSEHLALKKEVMERDHHLHLDILTKYNLDNY